MANSTFNGEPLEILHIEGRRSLRVIWLCEELGIPYSLSYKRGDVIGSLMSLREKNPAMPIVPSVRFGDDWIVESGAILSILQARYGNGRLVPPVDSPDYPHHAQWMHYAEGTAAARLMSARLAAMAAGQTPDDMPKGYRRGDRDNPENFAQMVGPWTVFDHVEEYLTSHRYFSGKEFGMADIMMHFPVRMAHMILWIDIAQDYPAIAEWRTRVEQRPAFERASAAAAPDGVDESGVPANDPAEQLFGRPKVG